VYQQALAIELQAAGLEFEREVKVSIIFKDRQIDTQPGWTLGEVFEVTQGAYAKTGYPDEWRLHHQGGPAGFEPREYVAVPGSSDLVSVGQVYAWNPSITGAKSEDTILVGEDGNEVLTTIPDWPMLSVAVEGHADRMPRPAILEIE
jgi:antitoxin VapB